MATAMVVPRVALRKACGGRSAALRPGEEARGPFACRCSASAHGKVTETAKTLPPHAEPITLARNGVFPGLLRAEYVMHLTLSNRSAAEAARRFVRGALRTVAAVGTPLQIDCRQKLLPGFRPRPEGSQHTAGHHCHVRFVHASCRHALMAALDDNADSEGL